MRSYEGGLKVTDSKIIVVTGISGSGSKDFCRRYEKETNKKVRVYHTGDMIYELSQNYPEEPPIPKENILNQPPRDLEKIQNEAFRQIKEDIKLNADNYERFIIDTHAQFYWNGCLINAYSWKNLNDISPDLFITIINKPEKIKKNQMMIPEGQMQDHEMADLELWQNLEVNITSILASSIKKPSYVLPAPQDTNTAESLLYNCFLVYFQMPITGISAEQNKKISDFKEKLADIGRNIKGYGMPTPIIDPRTIDMYTGPYLNKRTRKIARQQTNFRDLNWYIRKATHLLAFYPENTENPEDVHISIGVSIETVTGYYTGKDAFVNFPKKDTSPFFDLSTGLYKNSDKLLMDFKGHMKRRLNEFKRENISFERY